ncbi:MAG: FAD-dependent oxidoreductase [Epsilonproteobacteria bacterium]|nr:FAD-dependent oxidoreductase [Campylobacterota bacterium]OIO15002.1 MAG: formate dehydrogenase [Helicobacteraceae bacterium CG1_02_36_14]PIP10540.1 MAG: formate dehydrogenase [Sulfurimonas sp. CG23_combo_of_CG06-09_8_20_14_all_36_33]PIS26990.1 MAG: formate dehydrogenase [Sulfurimonas sp. CG08_land_8_20_14_0_20_36_33]PIU35884.1 MAG: formate dehydrogenase [Sulfurimonas sp. CG07_land_8_20_14_0_80_36_56]PIV03461.1 MAG: formate dehydrogenase [Sulfurimonas sp. CG03_land_8_20_14_0_80_36_25]PIV354
MSKVYFSTWNGELINNVGKPEEEWEESAYNLPAQYDSHRESKAFIGWDGVSLFNADVDVIRLAMEYAAQYQEYSEACGRCAPGRWGGRILYDQLDKIARGEGNIADLDHLREIGKSMQLTSKCEIGKTVPNPIIDLMNHFEDEFLDCINNQKPSKHYNESVGYIAKITAPCTDACPAHVDIPAYIEGVRDLKLEDSLKATRQTMPLAHVCGRVCPHPCEDACRRTNLDAPIAIMELKRIGSDYETDHGFGFFHPMKKAKSIGKKVAVIGAGPAGLTTAYYLAADGVEVDVYEELPVLGGEVAVGVPEYRMPIDKYNQDIECVRDMGVNFITNSKINADDMRRFETEYDATMVATGTRISKKIRCDNERPEIEGYWSAIEMLDQINLWEKYGIGKRVDLTGKTLVCVGGGFTSMDVVRCAIRANAKKVYMIYRRDEKTIIGNTTYDEYHEAVEEGVEFLFHSAVDKMIDEGDVLKSLLVDKYELVPDPDGGRPQLLKIEGESYMIETDYLIPAVSQDADLSLLPPEWSIEMTSWATIKTNGKDYMTSRKGIFASGDCEYGPMTIVNAVGQAKRAASVMTRYLQTGEISLSDDEIMEDHLRKLRVYDKKEKVSGWLPGVPRAKSAVLSVDERKYNNKEVNFGFSQEEAISEAERCMRCYYIAMIAT